MLQVGQQRAPGGPQWQEAGQASAAKLTQVAQVGQRVRQDHSAQAQPCGPHLLVPAGLLHQQHHILIGSGPLECTGLDAVHLVQGASGSACRPDRNRYL